MDRLDDIVKLVGSNAVGKKEGHFVVQKYIGKKKHNIHVEYILNTHPFSKMFAERPDFISSFLFILNVDKTFSWIFFQ